MGVAKRNAPGNVSTALKLIVCGMEDLKTAQAVFARISATLMDIDPELEIAEVKGDKAKLN